LSAVPETPFQTSWTSGDDTIIGFTGATPWYGRIEFGKNGSRPSAGIEGVVKLDSGSEFDTAFVTAGARFVVPLAGAPWSVEKDDTRSIATAVERAGMRSFI
jgi:hypothetical protein